MASPAPSAASVRADGAGLPDLRGAVLRANPAYELVPLERLPAGERALAGEASAGEDLYGLLRPAPGSALAPRAAGADLALLVLTLREPGPLPAFAERRLAGDPAPLARLVLDGVLEVEREGAFVSGPAALGAPARAPAPSSRVAELSLAALRHGAALEGVPLELLAFRLYAFGRRPLTPRLAARLPDERAVARFLGVDGPALGAFAESGTRPGDAWRMWRRRARRARAGRGGASFKLYVAPRLEHAPAALAALAEAAADLPGCEGFKAARDAAGLCRPDKLVAYFGRVEDLHAAAARLGRALGGLEPQPVPFTGAVDPAGVLSFGVDPAGAGGEGRSWRLWLAGRLALYLEEGRAAGADPCAFALERIRLDGIDVDAWAPASTGWDGTR
ncbi:MAG TPA: hypothetical protein VFB42_13145 [Gaiellaceae bacterium]|nr:hypothetical protein [Gaiellaceae bacterium]